MAWDFKTDPDYQERLDWVDQFVRERVEPLDLVLGDPFDKEDAVSMRIVRPLQEEVKARDLWAAHLTPALGGGGYGQLKLALLNEILGRSRWAPSVFGCQAPDSGNAEILAHYGTDEQKERYLQPLLDGEISSSYSMTEPQGGSDPTLFTTRAVRDGDEWVINGEKWFSSNVGYSSFILVMAVTDPDAVPHDRLSMFIVPGGTPGVEVVRTVHLAADNGPNGTHDYVRYTDVRVPDSCLLGGEGKAFEVAQTRLSGGRIGYGTRTLGLARQVLDMMCERALSRNVRSGPLASLGVVQEQIADSWVQLRQFRLLVMHAAWMVDQTNDYRRVRKEIAAVKIATPTVLRDITQRALHLHGALGVSDEMPFGALLVWAEVMGIGDGPTEVHKLTIAKELLKDRQPTDGLFPTAHLPTRRDAARAALADVVDRASASL